VRLRIFLMLLLWDLLTWKICCSSIGAGDIATKVKSLFDSESSALEDEKAPLLRTRKLRSWGRESSALEDEKAPLLRTRKLRSWGREAPLLRTRFQHCKMTLRSKPDNYPLILESMQCSGNYRWRRSIPFLDVQLICANLLFAHENHQAQVQINNDW